MAARSKAKQVGFGGSAGGGKTDLMLGLALTQHKRSLILRHEGTQLRAIIDRSKEIIGSQGQLNETLHIWRGLPQGRMIHLGGVAKPGDEKKYQGQPHDLKAFDEATEFLEAQVRFVIGWNRSSDPNQFCRQLFTFNPPTTAEGRWVISFWKPWLDDKHPDPARPGELRYFTTLKGKEIECESGEPFLYDGKLVTPVSRTFIPSRLTDNAYYSGTDYESNLQALPEPLRSQMLEGDFRAGMEDDPQQVIPTAWVKAAMERGKAQPRPPEVADPRTGEMKPLGLSAIGVDVARGGKDKTVISRRYGNWFAPLLKYQGTQTDDGPKVAELVSPHYVSGAIINIDVIGVGGSAYDQIRQKGFTTSPISVGSKSDATDKSGMLKFANLRSEVHWRFREALDPYSGENLALPDDQELLADLCSARWESRASTIYIEKKEEIKRRIGRSPDCSDAVLLAYYQSPAQSLLNFYSQAYQQMQKRKD